MTTEALYLDLFSRHDYAIVDLISIQEERWHSTLPMTRLVPKVLESDAEKMPSLLPLEPGAPYLADLADDLCIADEQGFKPLVSCLLAVPPGTDPERLQWHLTERLVLHNPQGRAFLRYYDSLVFLHFERILRPPQLQALYGPVSEWSIRFQKDWIALPTPDVEDVQTVPLVWQVNRVQSEAVDRIGTVNLALKLIRERRRRPWESLDEWRAAAAWIDASIDADSRHAPDAAEDDLARRARDKFLDFKNQTQI